MSSTKPTLIAIALLAALAAFFMLAPTPEQKGSPESELVSGVVENRRGHDVRYVVYLPAGYRQGNEKYPVLYLFHGYGGDETAWSNAEKGRMQEICDRYFDAKPERKRIVVMPDARDTWYRNVYNSNDQYETFFFKKFVPKIEKKFRCKTDRADRAVAGLSMGGYGTLLYALRHPDKFSAAYAMSPDSIREIWLPNCGENQPDARQAYADENNVLQLLDKAQDKNAVRFTIDCGDDDFCLPGACEFFHTARELDIPCELRVRDGGHTWDYWRDSLPKALDFVSGDAP